MVKGKRTKKTSRKVQNNQETIVVKERKSNATQLPVKEPEYGKSMNPTHSKSLPLGAVKRSALKYKASPTFDKLAIPKKRMIGIEYVPRENAYVISRNALNAKPSPRITELAQPKTRSVNKNQKGN